jgi:hypothetical protein
MYHTISDINKTINLQQYIDNKCGNKKIGLKSFTYTIGWYNLIDGNIEIKTSPRKPVSHKITDGFYSLQDITEKLKTFNIELTVNMQNGIVYILPENEIRISPSLLRMLGIEKRDWIRGLYTGDKPVDFAPYKQLYVHLEQLNSSSNFFDGAPSNILGIVPIENKSFGDIVHTHLSNPDYKQLAHGDISELSISVRDDNGKKINNNGFQITCVLKIK